PCRSSSAAASASACEREPGLTMTWRTPRATSRSRTSQAASLLAVIVVCVVVLVGLLGVRHVERLLHVKEGDLFFQFADPVLREALLERRIVVGCERCGP